MNFLSKIFSIKTEMKDYRTQAHHNVFTFFGIKFKFKTKITDKTIHCNKKLKNCVAVISVDGIGDYMFVRQFFKYIKLSKKYKDCPLVLFEQPNHYKYAKIYDSKYFDDIVLFTEDANFLVGNIRKIINNYEFTSVINLTNRPITRKLVKIIKAKEKCVEYVTKEICNCNKKMLSEYNNIIYTNPSGLEWERRRVFFEKLLDLEIPSETLNIEPIIDFRNKYIVVSIMAMNKNRCYSEENWIEILNYITTHVEKDVKILFIGGRMDYDCTQKIIDNLINNSICINFCGLTDSVLIPVVIKNAEFLLSPETGTVHIAAAMNTKTVCLSCGANYGRCLPHKNVIYVFPDAFDEILKRNDKNEIEEYYYYNYKLGMNSIIPQKVIKKISEVMSEQKILH